MEPLRDRAARERRLDEDRVHVFSLRDYAAALRKEPELRENGHTGVILVKSDELRSVLEVAEAGASLSDHVIHGPAIVQVVEGVLDFEVRGEHHSACAGEVVVLPHDETRSLTAREPSCFLLTLALRHPLRHPAT